MVMNKILTCQEASTGSVPVGLGPLPASRSWTVSPHRHLPVPECQRGLSACCRGHCDGAVRLEKPPQHRDGAVSPGLTPGVGDNPRKQLGSLWSRLVPAPMGLEGALPLEGLGLQPCGTQLARPSLGEAAERAGRGCCCQDGHSCVCTQSMFPPCLLLGKSSLCPLFQGV